MSRWQSLGSPPPNSLAQARLDAHYSAQIPSAAGVSLLDPAPDDSHSNLGWSEDLRALVGRPVPEEKPFQAALRISDLTLLLLDAEGMSLADFSLRAKLSPRDTNGSMAPSLLISDDPRRKRFRQGRLNCRRTASPGTRSLLPPPTHWKNWLDGMPTPMR